MIRTNFYNIFLYDNLLVVESFKTWDRAVAKGCLEDIIKIVTQHYPDKPYAILEDARKWELNTPDAMNFWKETFAKRYSYFPTHVAYVVGESELKHWAVERMLDDTIPFKMALFSEIEEGFDWLESNGYKISNPDIS